MDGPTSFTIHGNVRQIEVISSGRGVRARHALRRQHGGQRWRKMKGVATVQEHTGEIYEAEIHWYEAHGVGRRNWKIKG